MRITDRTSQKIKNMSIVCAVLIVTIHVDWPHDTFSFTSLVHQFIKYGIAQIAVPFFFVVSGFFLSKHMQDVGWYGAEVRKRIYTLIVPYFAWAAVSLVAIGLMTDLPSLNSVGRLLAALGFHPLRGPTYLGALWYVRCLFFFVATAPVFKWLVFKGKVMWLVCAFAFALVHASWKLPYPIQEWFLYGFSISGVFYFSCGIFIGLFNCDIHKRAVFVLSTLVGLALLFARSLFLHYEINTHVNLMAIAIPLLMYSTWYLMPAAKWPVRLTSCSFPIFLMHMLFIPCLTHYVVANCGGQMRSIIAFFGASLMPVALAQVIRAYFPRINAFLFAGRC